MSPRFGPLLAEPPAGLRVGARGPLGVAVELDARLREAREALALELLDGVRAFETTRFRVPGARRTLALDTARPTIVGILNRTPDSFSDGGRLRDLDAVYAHAEELLRGGATWLDLGGESTRPGAPPVPQAEELARVLPALEGLVARFEAWISIDTRSAAVARAALGAGADLVNDVSAGNGDPLMLATCAELGAPIVLNHMRGTPETMREAPRYTDVVAEVAEELGTRLEASLKAGIALPRILLDPGLGFGKHTEENLRLLGGVAALRTFGRPIFVGASRKSFLGSVLAEGTLGGDRGGGDRLGGPPPSERDDATSATTAHLAACGVAAIRVHDARRAADVARVAARLAQEERPLRWFSERDPAVEEEAEPPREERLSG